MPQLRVLHPAPRPVSFFSGDFTLLYQKNCYHLAYLRWGKIKCRLSCGQPCADQESTPALIRELLVCGNCQFADVKEPQAG